MKVTAPPTPTARSLHEICESARQVNCGHCWALFDPPERQKGPGAQFRDGDGLMGWAEVYAPDRQETAPERNYRYLQRVIAMQQGQVAWPRQPLAGIWKSEGTGENDGRWRRQTGGGGVKRALGGDASSTSGHTSAASTSAPKVTWAGLPGHTDGFLRRCRLPGRTRRPGNTRTWQLRGMA